MRILACSTLLFPLLAIGCTPEDSNDDGATTMPILTTSATDSGSGTNGPGTDGPGTTEDPPLTTAATTATDDGPLDSSGTESGETSAGGMPGDWLLTVDNGISPPALVHVALDGTTTEICTLASTVTYNSLVFDRAGTLWGHNDAAGRIDTINPCNCSFQIVGPTSLGTLSLGIGAPDDEGLIALDTALDGLVRIDTETGLGTVVGPLGFMFGTGSLAWANAIAGPYAIEGDNDYLYSIDTGIGASTALQPLTEDVTDPGLAVHPNDGVLYVCSGDAFYTLSPATGMMVPVGTLGLTGGCQTLAAPQTAVACLDSL